jgi:hypothetical protein
MAARTTVPFGLESGWEDRALWYLYTECGKAGLCFPLQLNGQAGLCKAHPTQPSGEAECIDV